MNDFVLGLLYQQKEKAENSRAIVKAVLDGSKMESELSNEEIMAIYPFKEKFFRLKKKNPIFSHISDNDNSEDAKRYLEATYPFCFDMPIDNIMFATGHSMNSNKVELLYYAICLGATREQLDGLDEFLRQKKLITKDFSANVQYDGNIEKGLVNTDDICGSAVKAYNSSNLLAAFNAISDKNSFVGYMLSSGVMVDPGKVFDGICVKKMQDGYWVTEGNHRIITYKAIQAVREFVTGQPCRPIYFDANIQKVRIAGLDVVQDYE